MCVYTYMYIRVYKFCNNFICQYKIYKMTDLSNGPLISMYPAFFQAKHKQNGSFAALKQVDITSEEDLEDYCVEIDILTECQHENIVGLHEAFYWDSKLWVGTLCCHFPCHC